MYILKRSLFRRFNFNLKKSNIDLIQKFAFFVGFSNVWHLSNVLKSPEKYKIATALKIWDCHSCALEEASLLLPRFQQAFENVFVLKDQLCTFYEAKSTLKNGMLDKWSFFVQTSHFKHMIVPIVFQGNMGRTRRKTRSDTKTVFTTSLKQMPTLSRTHTFLCHYKCDRWSKGASFRLNWS